MLPSVSLALLGLNLPLSTRAIGAITGSRVAGAIGQGIIFESIDANQLRFKELGFATNEQPVSLCTWVDNLYSFSTYLCNAVSILDILEGHLKRVWGLTYKDNSRATMVCRGSDAQPADPVRWPLRSSLNILGHIVQNDGGVRVDWISTMKAPAQGVGGRQGAHF